MNNDISLDELHNVELSPNAQLVLEKRYLKRDSDGTNLETPKQMFWRVASSIAAEEQKYSGSSYDSRELAKDFYNLLARLDFLPNSPTLMNAGTGIGQLAACFVLPVEDSLDKIFDSIKHAALIHKSGGGTGFSFSKLRPKNSKVGSTGGIASGPLSFLKIFNTATEQVKQGGTRRGANMGVLRVDHPDILEFIKSKEHEDQLNNFNLSVALTEEFMNAVEDDTEYSLIDPHTGEVTGKLRASEVFWLLVRKAWESGDPGMIFIDKINRDNPTPAQGEIESTNPCVTSDTFVMTTQGPRQVADLKGKQFSAVVNGQVYPSSDQGFFVTGHKHVLTLKTKQGYKIKLTPDHPVLRAASVQRGSIIKEWIRAKDLKPEDRICLGDHRSFQGWTGKYGEDEGYLVGLLLGDGVLKQDKAVISVWPTAEAANGDGFVSNGVMDTALQCALNLPHRSDFQGWQKIQNRGEYRLSLGHLKRICSDLDLNPENKRITPELEKCSSRFCAAFLSGLFDADGSVQGSKEKGFSIRLAQSDMQILEAAQRILHRLGIKSLLYKGRRPAGESLLPDGKGGNKEYATKMQHELVVSKSNLSIFASRIGFKDQDKQSRLETALSEYTRGTYSERFLATVDSLESAGEEEVFDVQIPGANCFDANGLVVHNCGEQPLLPYEACNLGSINLSRFYSSEHKHGIDWDRLREVVHLSVRFLDDVIDASNYPLEEINQKVAENRKVGLGLMGWADLLYRLELPYNSQKALNLAETLMEFFQQESKEASRILAQEKGPFPAYEKSIYAENNEGPYRNATTTTIAPTGTLSIIAGCSSGIEPLFALSFVRQVMEGERLSELNQYFKEYFENTEYYTPDRLQEIASKGTIRDLDYMPKRMKEIFVTSMDIEPDWHLNMQAAFQKHTDNAVSKTVNLPNSATQEDIYSIYWKAHELGCKGVTVFRDGSKSEQVLTKSDQTKEDISTQDSVVKERPEVMFGFTQKVETGLGELYLTVNEIDGRPFEVFATIGKSGRSITAKTEAIGRLVSLALRSGVYVKDIVKQLKGIGGEHPIFQKKGLLLSIPDAVAWVLENRYLKGEEPQSGTKSLDRPHCPECGMELAFQEGCFLCYACGYTKCG